MSDTVFEYPDYNSRRGYIGFTRFWKKSEDWIQVTLVNQDETRPEMHTWASLPFARVRESLFRGQG